MPMRSIVKQRRKAVIPVRYLMKRGAILIRGTVPYVSREQVTERLDQLSRGGRCYHVTLHPPAGSRVTVDDWRRVITTALVRLGAPLHGVGWLAGIHVNTKTLHVHVAVAGRTFLGLPVNLLKKDALSTAAHIDLARSMGLESPVYYDPDVPRLVPHSPVRRRNADEKLKKAHDELVDTFLAVQPTSLEQFNARLRVRGTGLELRGDGDLSRDGSASPWGRTSVPAGRSHN